MLNKNLITLLLSTILIVACIYFVSFANFEWNRNIGTETSEATKTHPLVLGKELQSVVEYLADDVLISVKTTEAYHSSRLSVLILTWMQSVPPSQVTYLQYDCATDQSQ